MPGKDHPSVSVTLRLFGRYGELAGTEVVVLALPRGSTVAEAVELLRREVPNGALLPEDPMTAVNHEQAAGDRVICEGDELALLPPLAGG